MYTSRWLGDDELASRSIPAARVIRDHGKLREWLVLEAGELGMD